MTEQEYKHNLAGADDLRSVSDYLAEGYWLGYARGMRRHYYGEKFGSADEHAVWLTLADETHDDRRRFRGIGYRVGLDGVSISDAIEYLKTIETLAAAARRLRAVGKISRH